SASASSRNIKGRLTRPWITRRCLSGSMGGYPVRLLLPGYEGNMNVTYLRRIKLVAEPAMGFWETKTYTQLLPNGEAYQFYFLQEVKSFITQPSPGMSLKQPGLYQISGVAYSGTGRIAKVMVSADW